VKNYSKMLLLAGLILLITGCITTNSDQSDVFQNEVSISGDVQTFQESTLDLSGPIPYLTLQGTPYEQGLAYGVLLRGSLRASSESFGQYQEARAASMPLYKRLFGGIYISIKINDFLKRTPQRYIDEMQGLADGSGGTLKQIALLSYSFSASAACTSVLSNPSENEGILHGRNWDFSPYLLGQSPILVKYEFQEGPAIWTVSTLGYLPFFHGCNEYGLSISLNTLDTNGSGEKGTPIVWKIREILENASSMEEADSILKSIENDSSNWLLTLASANEKKGRVYNLLNNLQQFEELQDDRPMIVVNHSYEPPDGPVNSQLKENTDFTTMIFESNQNRLDEACLYDSTNNPETSLDIWTILRNHDLTENRIWNNRGSIANYATMFSVVFDLANRRMSFSVSPSWASLRDVWEFNLDNNQFSLLLPADPYTKTDRFLANEASYFRIENEIINGTFDVGDLDYRMGPSSLLNYSLKIINFHKGSPEFLELLEKSLQEYPDLNFNNFALGYYYKYLDPERSISYFNTAIADPDVAKDYKLYGLQHMVDAYGEINDRTGRANAASHWLELFEEYSEGFYVSPYMQRVARKMERLAN